MEELKDKLNKLNLFQLHEINNKVLIQLPDTIDYQILSTFEDINGNEYINGTFCVSPDKNVLSGYGKVKLKKYDYNGEIFDNGLEGYGIKTTRGKNSKTVSGKFSNDFFKTKNYTEQDACNRCIESIFYNARLQMNIQVIKLPIIVAEYLS